MTATKSNTVLFFWTLLAVTATHSLCKLELAMPYLNFSKHWPTMITPKIIFWHCCHWTQIICSSINYSKESLNNSNQIKSLFYGKSLAMFSILFRISMGHKCWHYCQLLVWLYYWPMKYYPTVMSFFFKIIIKIWLFDFNHYVSG